MSKGVKKAEKKRSAQQRGEKKARRNCHRSERKYIAWRYLTRNQKEVARRLAHGEGCDFVHDGSWGFFDRFMIFLRGVNYLATLNLDGEGYARRMITVAKLLLTYQARILLGIDSMNKVHYIRGLSKPPRFFWKITYFLQVPLRRLLTVC